MLEKPLNVAPIDSRTRRAIIERFWSPAYLPVYHQSPDWNPFFAYYEGQCRAALTEGGRYVMARTHRDILSLIHSFEEHTSREVIKENLRGKLQTPGRPNEEEIVDGAIDLAARLYLMVNVAAEARNTFGQTRLQWTAGSLKQCVQTHFEEPQILSDVGLRLAPIFTAANLDYIGGFLIVSTDNLADHLRLMDRDGTIAVFCNVFFLQRHVRCVWISLPGTEKKLICWSVPYCLLSC